MGLVQVYETQLREHGIGSAQVLLTHADLADRERYLNARSTLLTLLALERHPGHQRERHRRHRRDQVRRQRHAGRAGGQPGRGRRAGDPHRPARPVLRRPAQGPGRAASSHERRAGDPALERMAGGAGSAIGRGGMITKVLAAKRAAGSGASDGHRLGPRARRAAAPGRRRGDRHRAGGGDAEDGGAQAVDGRPPATARRGRGRRRRGGQGARSGARACCRSASSRSQGEFQRGDVIAVRALRRRGDRARPGQLHAAPRRG